MLRPDGILWVNIADSYAGKPGGAPDDKEGMSRTWGARIDKPVGGDGLKPKDLCLVPARLALALHESGWWVRKDVIWSKTRPMPESVRDRPASAHEYVFMLTKSRDYFYDHLAVRTSLAESSVRPAANDPAARPKKEKQRGHSRRHDGFNDRWDSMTKAEQQANGANLRDVWTGAPPQFPGAHFATMPEWMVETCLKASTREGDMVLDPFMGAGTTLLVANRMKRDAIGIELNEAYVEMAERRLLASGGLLCDIRRDAA